MEMLAQVVAEGIRQAGYQLSCHPGPNGQPVVVATSNRSGRVWSAAADNELAAMTDLTRRLLLEDRN